MSTSTVHSGLSRLLALLRDFLTQQTELTERRLLLDRPREEEFLHWGQDGRIHGHLLPPPGRRRLGTTRSGWCPGLRACQGDRT
ncbi:MAG TPA: hypothetical protein VJT49_26920 [Amycolatopsis sp.]|uniref:hypothetical protein n=1 Tax=Amycolatopsis sp. TaxID=37632 RepID=UPI002B47AEAC|nr:hypothetical protein [Amycolatopsis sp.]HKS48674.1 hypothetical protein [Amycolatopsis sp.]